MLLDLGMIVLGIAGLWVGGNLLVKSASRLAISFGASSVIIGLTVVAWATSSPELLVSVSAAIQGSSDIAIGNVVGSNIVNIGLILGLTAFIFPVRIQRDFITREMPIMIAVALLSFVLSMDGVISRVDGLILFAGFVAYNVMVLYIIRNSRDAQSPDMPQAEQDTSVDKATIRRPIEGLRLAASLVFLAVGAQLTLTGSTSLARQVGISELVIGLTLVAAGTSLPEFATSMIAAAKKNSDIAVGNVVGSNIANVLAILGLTAIIQPVSVAPDMILTQFPAMILFSVGLLLFSLVRVIGRVQGILIMGAYVVYVLVTFSAG